MNKFILRLIGVTTLTTMLFSGVSVYATELPDTIIRNGKVFVKDVSAGGGKDTAIPDFSTMSQRSYKVLGSDVALYIDYSHGHGGDHFASGWVRATAPRFTARAEVWANGRVDTTGSNVSNVGDTATATSYLAVGIVKNATPRIFYSW